MTLELGVYSFGNTPRTAAGGYGPTSQATRNGSPSSLATSPRRCRLTTLRP